MPKSSVSLKFADGEYLFALPAKRIYEIEDACGTGLGAIYARTLRGRFPMMGEDVPHSGALPTEADFKFRELVVVIQQALIGGGRGNVRGESVIVDQYRANDLIDRYILNDGDDRTILTEVWKLAAAILITLVEGFVPPKKKEDQPVTKPTRRKGSTGQDTSPTAR